MDCTSTLESKKVCSSQSLVLQETPLRQEIDAATMLKFAIIYISLNKLKGNTAKVQSPKHDL